MAICDSSYNFVAINVGMYGRSADSQVIRINNGQEMNGRKTFEALAF